MSMEPPPSISGRPRKAPSADKDSVPTAAGKLPGIRRQAAWIAEQVLAGADEEQASVRALLREHLAAYPGRPEIALAEHLISLRALTDQPPMTVSGLAPIPRAPATESGDTLSTRIEKVLRDRMLVTALQPIRELSTGSVVGAEALTRFVSDGGDAAGEWFAAAAEARLESELEFAALECALAAAEHLPTQLFVALKVSPATCLHPLLPGLLGKSMPALDRLVLELTGPLTQEEPAALIAALAPLRSGGVRLAVTQFGGYRDSLRHIRQLQPDIIKLDRSIVAGINADAARHALGETMTWFAEQLGATLVAEGIETEGELAAIAGLGVTAGQGYYLGRPSIRPQDWAGWNDPAREYRTSGHNRSARRWEG
jgi:EAL domain-containing protein (putative c-di-GMP-specific phosphodiesterase class I)